MQIVTYNAEGTEGPARVGLLAGGRVLPLAGHADMRAFIEAGPAAWRAAADSVATADSIPLEQVTLLAPIHNPSKVVAIGLNYMDHCREQNVEPPPKPLV